MRGTPGRRYRPVGGGKVNSSGGFVDLFSSMTDLLVLLAVLSIRRSLLQHHNSKLSIVLFSVLFVLFKIHNHTALLEKLMYLLFGILL